MTKERTKTLIFNSNHLFCIQSSPNKTPKKHQTSQYRGNKMLLRTTTTVPAHQQLGCDPDEAQPSPFPSQMCHLLHVPSLWGHRHCQAGDSSQVKGEKGVSVSGLYQYPAAFIKYRTSKRQATRSEQPPVRKQLHVKKTALSKPTGFKSCVK